LLIDWLLSDEDDGMGMQFSSTPVSGDRPRHARLLCGLDFLDSLFSRVVKSRTKSMQAVTVLFAPETGTTRGRGTMRAFMRRGMSASDFSFFSVLYSVVLLPANIWSGVVRLLEGAFRHIPLYIAQATETEI
jgi:hypothetical protein